MIRKFSQYISFSKEQGSVKRKSKLNIEVTFSPLVKYKLKPHSNYFIINIVSGPSYKIALKGEGKTPGVLLNFKSYDFGPCFVLK